MTATFTAASTGSRAGATVVPVYVHQPVSDIVAPPQRLAGFARVELAVGGSQVVHVSFPVSRAGSHAGGHRGHRAPGRRVR